MRLTPLRAIPLLPPRPVLWERIEKRVLAYSRLSQPEELSLKRKPLSPALSQSTGRGSNARKLLSLAPSQSTGRGRNTDHRDEPDNAFTPTMSVEFVTCPACTVVVV